MPNRKKPISQHKLHGTYRKDRHGGENPKPELISFVPDPPKHFNKWAKTKWAQVLPELIRLELVSRMDLLTLEDAFFSYGVAMAIMDKLKKINREKGLKGDPVANYLDGKNSQTAMLWQEYKHSMTRYNTLMVKFGVTPVERTKIKLRDPGEENDKDKKEKDAVLRIVGRNE